VLTLSSLFSNKTFRLLCRYCTHGPRVRCSRIVLIAAQPFPLPELCRVQGSCTCRSSLFVRRLFPCVFSEFFCVRFGDLSCGNIETPNRVTTRSGTFCPIFPSPPSHYVLGLPGSILLSTNEAPLPCLSPRFKVILFTDPLYVRHETGESPSFPKST